MPYRALVVDDEQLVRDLIVRSLEQEGFQCDSAVDGEQAQDLCDANEYDALVTDLRMPRQNGHTLAVHVLEQDNPPVVVALTGVAEPALARDLISRGVYDVIFKPANHSLLAVKLRALVEGRRSAGKSQRLVERFETNDDDGRPQPVSATVLQSKLQQIPKLLPISQAALDVFNMASSGTYDARQIAAAGERDASFVAEMLRLANSSYYNPSSDRVADLEGAIARIGQRRVGELALATNALAALTANVLPWMDIGLAWRRSVAAGVALELLVEQGQHEAIQTGLLTSATMYNLGRVALASIFPQHYEWMVHRCRQSQETLLSQEKKVFPKDHAEVLADLLATWNIPAEIHDSLNLSLTDYASIATRPEHQRSRAELIKLSVLLGELAVGTWEPWDTVEVPPERVFERLNVSSFSGLVEQTRKDTESISQFRTWTDPQNRVTIEKPARTEGVKQISYVQVEPTTIDVLAALLPSMNFRATAVQDGERLLVNGVGTPPGKLASYVRQSTAKNVLVVADTSSSIDADSSIRQLSTPCSYQSLQSACATLGVA